MIIDTLCPNCEIVIARILYSGGFGFYVMRR